MKKTSLLPTCYGSSLGNKKLCSNIFKRILGVHRIYLNDTTGFIIYIVLLILFCPAAMILWVIDIFLIPNMVEKANALASKKGRTTVVISNQQPVVPVQPVVVQTQPPPSVMVYQNPQYYPPQQPQQYSPQQYPPPQVPYQQQPYYQQQPQTQRFYAQ